MTHDLTTLPGMAPSAAFAGRPLVLLPWGSFEQHGPHLPVATDTVVAAGVAEAVATRLRESGDAVVVVPAVAYGSSGEHQAFAGTVSIGTDVVFQAATELVRSIGVWARSVVIVNGHGGNAVALDASVSQLRAEGHDVSWVACEFPGADAHAGFAETCLMLHLAPRDVAMERAEVGNTAPLAELMETMRRDGVGAVAPNGVLGDPRGATPHHGSELLDALASRICAALVAGVVDARGRVPLGAWHRSARR